MREFLALDERTSAVADEYAARLGVSRSRLYALSRATSALRTEAARPSHANLGQWRLDPASEDLIAGAARACGPDATIAEVTRAVVSLAAIRRAPAPSQSVVRRRLLAHRAALRADGAGGLVLDEVDLDLGIPSEGNGLVSPTLSALIDTRTTHILGHALVMSRDAAEGGRAAVANALRTSMDRGDRQAVEAVAHSFAAEDFAQRGAVLGMVFGTMLGPIRLLTRKRRSPRRGRTPATSLEDASLAVAQLLHRHNESLQASSRRRDPI